MQKKEETYVTNQYGDVIYYPEALDYMDNDIREQLHNDISPCTPQYFFDAYATLHAIIYGEPWFLDLPNPCY